MFGSTLHRRLMAAMGGIALLTALIAGLLVAPLIGTVAEDAVREPLARQASFLARVPMTGLASTRLQTTTGRANLDVGLVAADGTAQGVAAALSAEELDTLQAGRPVSTEAVVDGTRLVIEARPVRGGGAVVLATDADIVDSASATLRRRVLLALAIGLVVAIGVAALLSSRLGRPLTRTAQAAQRMAAGERGIELTRTGTAEVDDVIAALIALDVALSRSEGRQRDFLLSVSHELRTPLTAVRGYAEALADEMIAPDDVAEVAATLVAEARRMDCYVGYLLALARLQADDFALSLGPVDVPDLLATTARAWAERAQRAGVTVEVDVPAEGAPAEARTDGARLRPVVDALVDNAVRVCSPGDRVLLAGNARPGGGVRVEVRDTGPGLNADDARVAFEPGALHERYAGDRACGHGVGLALAHRLVGRLGGTIVVQPAAEGGAAFVIDLPGPPPTRRPGSQG
ncbi:HAMP domain-containing sensor histidine kinase [soil metagenome]